MATSMPLASRTVHRSFYVVVALLALLLIFAGFARTYYLKALYDTPALPSLIHLHGLVMTGWFALFLLQTGLIATHRVGVHRRLGAMAAGWAVLVLVVGALTAVNGARRGASPGPPPLVFLAVPLADLVVFASLTGAGLWFRRRPEVHRRLMLMGSVGILTPAIARLPVGIIQRGGPPVGFGVLIALAAACVAFDTWRHRRLHPAFGWALLIVVASVPLRIGIAGTQAWIRFATWLTS